jgi:hypothetical protein
MAKPKQEVKVEAAQQVGLMVRLPVSLRDWVRERATRNRRSGNSEIVCLLEQVQKDEQAAKTKNPPNA